MRILTFILLLSLLISCGNDKADAPSSFINEGVESKIEILNISEEELAQYGEVYETADVSGKELKANLLKTIKQFNKRLADTTIYTIGNIDGVGLQDTVKTHVYIHDDTVFVDSKWTRGDEILWEGKIKNPYLYVSDDDMFSYLKRPLWVIFAIAVNFGAPELSHMGDYAEIDRELALKMGVDYIQSTGLDISLFDYRQYFETFEGDLFLFGEPEARSELLLWYEPQKKFVLYYSP